MRKALLLFGLSIMTVLVFAPMALAQDEFNCSDFDSQEEAQAEFDRVSGDPNNLDADNDGEACETYPYDDGGDDNGTAAGDQYNGGVDDGGGVVDGGSVDDSDEIISDTISKKPLPNTGGVPLLGLAVGVLALLGVGFSVLRT